MRAFGCHLVSDVSVGFSGRLLFTVVYLPALLPCLDFFVRFGVCKGAENGGASDAARFIDAGILFDNHPALHDWFLREFWFFY